MTQQATGIRMNGLLIGLLVGTAVGATLGMLYAPKSGKETRTAIRERFRAWRKRAGEEASGMVTAFQRGEHDENIEGAA